MEAIMRALGDQHAELDGLLSELDEAGWARPVPNCPGWVVSDVVLHLAQTDELTVACAEEGFFAATRRMLPDGTDPGSTPDEAVALMVDHQRGAPGAEVRERWRAASAAVRAELGGSDPRRPMKWVVNDLPARTLATTRLAECWIHTGDVAGALDVPLEPAERLWHIARLAWRTIPFAFARAGHAPPAGPVAVTLTAPDGGTWDFREEGPPETTIAGPALDFCLVAGRRLDPEKSNLAAEGTDAEKVLSLVRTYA